MNLTLIIIIITGLLSYQAFQKPIMKMNWMFNAYQIKTKKQYYRFLTSGFIHNDWGHLIFNMFTMYFLGSGVELYFSYYFPEFGSYYFIALYIGAIVVSGIPSYIKHHEHIYYNSLGASGGTSSLVFAFIILTPTTPLCLFGILCLPGFILGSLYLIYTVNMSKTKMDNINHDAHLWGSIFGLLFLLILDWQIFIRFVEEISNYSFFN